MRERDREFGEFFDARVAAMRRTAFLLCGDWHRAEDLTQVALEKLYAVWPRLRPDAGVDAYARQILVRVVIDDSRRGFRRSETAVDTVPDVPSAPLGTDDALDVRRALAALPPGQRAAVVLRYWEDLPIEETANLLGCSEGTVKSQAAKGLATLRRLLGAAVPTVEEKR